MAQTLGQAYASYGAARRDWMEDERRDEGIKGGLKAGADLAFAASGELEAAEKTSQEFKTAEKMLGDDVQQIDLETGEAWKERSILGRGDSVSYLNPFEWGGERGLRVGETLYSSADVSGISQSEEYLNIQPGNEKAIAGFRENIKSVYGTDVKETDWWKKEQADKGRRVIGEAQAGMTLESLHRGFVPRAGEIGETKTEKGFVPQRELARINKAEANWQRYKQDLIKQTGEEAGTKARAESKAKRESTPEWKEKQLRIKMEKMWASRGRVKPFTESEEAEIKTATETRMAPLRSLESQLKERDYKYMPGKDLEGDQIWSELMEQIRNF